MTALRYAWRAPAVDAAMADALAVMTLYSSGRPGDAERAEELLDELAKHSDGPEALVGGLASVAASLLLILEFEASIPPAEALGRLGELLAYNEALTQPGCG